MKIFIYYAISLTTWVVLWFLAERLTIKSNLQRLGTFRAGVWVGVIISIVDDLIKLYFKQS